VVWTQGCDDLIHRLLIAVHTTNNPQVIVVSFDCIFGREGQHWGNALDALEFTREFVLNKDTTLRGSEISTSLPKTLLVKWFVHNSDAGTAVNRNAD
jgi:hypothetical protein